MQAMDVCSSSNMNECGSSQKSGNWEFANTLGEGAYGEVKLAVNTLSNETRAVKIISLNLLNDKTAIQKEVLIHKTLNHENIIKYYSSFQQVDKFYIILEYAAGGELFDRIEPDLGMSLDLAHKYFRQLIAGVEYLHTKGIVHRDIKPENLLLNDADQIKIADFGLATLFQYRGNERLLTSPCGTAPYVAPEVLCKSDYKAQPTDIWSCGIVLVAMLAGELPWDKPVLDCADFVAFIKAPSCSRTPWCKIDNTALSLIRNVLRFEPTQRFTIAQIKASTWFVRTHKEPAYESSLVTNSRLIQRGGFDDDVDVQQQQQQWAFLSQPSYCYLNNEQRASAAATTATNMARMALAAELEVTDSQQNCECSSVSVNGVVNAAAAANSSSSDLMSVHNSFDTTTTEASTTTSAAAATKIKTHHFESFSQPISTDNMILNSQLNLTQGPGNSQYSSSQYGSSQSPFLRLVKRMTRMFVHASAETCCDELAALFTKFMYDYKVTITNERQRQLTVITSDKRQTLLSFKVNVIEMVMPSAATAEPAKHNEVLVDFRLSKGDGLEFKKIFMKIKASLAHIACKRYVFANNARVACCDNRQQQQQHIQQNLF